MRKLSILIAVAGFMAANVSIAGEQSNRCPKAVGVFLQQMADLGGPVVQAEVDRIDQSDMVSVKDARPAVVALFSELKLDIALKSAAVKTQADIDAIDAEANSKLAQAADIAESHADNCPQLRDEVEEALRDASEDLEALASNQKLSALEKMEVAAAQEDKRSAELEELVEYKKCREAGNSAKQCK